MPDTTDSLTDSILSGQSLAVYLEPDETLFAERTAPEYWETYELPNIKVEDTLFFGYSEPNHAAGAMDEAISAISAYSYCNFTNCFLNFTCNSRLKALEDSPVPTLIMSRNRYKTFRFIVKANYMPVWDSDAPAAADTIVPFLKQGLKFKAALQDDQGVWHIHPVDLPFYWPNTDRIQVQTHISIHPAFLTQPRLFRDTLVPKHKMVFDPDTPRPDAVLEFEAPPACSYFSAYSDGTYFTAEERMSGVAPRTYKRLRIFCENPV